ncbi:hypothetical protein [Alienimonas chondri]|uniref:Uncharacterized protein n=1 Tax=Alienimonas chondri TaxID=2681879 RepID=A0ABX1VBZ3_9PLAN|nr:hypothetical protein [Alienimonas chondri]NNJ25603.1 hypothetical protein [Alienimonas chondri]
MSAGTGREGGGGVCYSGAMPESPAPTAAVAVGTPDAPSAPAGTHESTATVVASRSGADPFTADEYRQFAMEDGRAGKLIGWLLCALFVYTILVASAAIWWTVQAS